MITINKRNYQNPLIKVSFGEYNINYNGKKRKGEAIFLSFKLDNIYIGLETIYDKNWLKELNINDKKDISSFISDITYEDEKGWLSLIGGACKCFVNRIENNMFIFSFNCETEECGDYYTISVYEKVKIDLE